MTWFISRFIHTGKSLSSITALQIVVEILWDVQDPPAIGFVAYCVDLLPSSHIHLVFHVSLLEQHLGALIPIQPSLPDQESDIVQEPELILQRRMVPCHSCVVSEMLIK